MMRVRYTGLLVLYFFCITLDAQTPFLRSHHLFSGKEDYHVLNLMQDPSGLIWFGTDKGLFRFDGVNYEKFTVIDGLAEDRISSTCSIQDELIWIGHKNGSISIYDGRSFRVFQPEEGMGEVEITDIVVDHNQVIWFSTMGEGIYRFDGRHLANFSTDDGLSDDYVYDIEVCEENHLWIGTDYGFSRFANDTFSVISMKDGLPDNIIRTINLSGKRVWLGTDEAGICSYDPLHGGVISYGNWNYGPVSGIVSSLEDRVWVSTQRAGVIEVQVFPDSSAVYQQFSIDQGLVSNRVHTIIKDFEENIWLGGQRGIVQILPPVFEFLDIQTGAPFEKSHSLLKDMRGSLWVSSETGLYRGEAGISGQLEWTSISEQLEMPEVNFFSLYEDPGHHIWAGTYGHGVIIIDPLTLDYETLNTSNGLSNASVINISGKGNKIWMSTLGGGVNQFDLETQELHHFQHETLGESYVYSTQPGKDERIWIAGLLGQPYYILNDSIYALEDSAFVFPQLYGIASDSSGNIWLNTLDDGLVRIEDERLHIYGPKEGLNLQEIQSMAFDKFNNLLIFANTGMQIIHTGDNTSVLLDENMGLGYRYPLLNSVYRDRDDQIWFGTETGIIKYNPDYLYITGQKPRLFLSTVHLFDEPFDREMDRFRHRSNNFTFGYTGLWFKNPEMLTFRYELEGYDLNWNYYDRNRVINYPRLPPGDYTFRAEVSIDGQVWYKAEDGAYSFRITPPFWRRWFFIISMVILVIIVIVAYIRIRVANLERAKKLLENQVRHRTKEIANKNKELEAQKEEIETQRDYAEEQRDQIEHQKEDIQSSIRYAHRIQRAALPPESVMNSVLDDYFIYNRPRDIVSGDFYWASSGDPYKYFAVADCTGHGVPGAFMSMLGISALNDIVKSLEKISASVLLDNLACRVRESLHQTEQSTETSSSDGMDISLCIYDPGTKILQFSGAYNHLYIVRNGEMQIIKADKQSLVSKYFEPKPFNNHELKMEEGDCIYLFSDGFPDQFGGPDFKKYKIRNFREFLISIHKESMKDQKRLLDEEFERWMGPHAQVDDVIVMGIRIE